MYILARSQLLATHTATNRGYEARRTRVVIHGPPPPHLVFFFFVPFFFSFEEEENDFVVDVFSFYRDHVWRV